MEFDPAAYDVTIERTFVGPRERVWEAWTNPEQVAQWWGPRDFNVPRCEMNVRPGGAFRIDMEAPDGTVFPSEGVFDEVDEPDRLVLIGRAVEDDGNYQMEVRQTVTFEERGGRTELTLEAEVVSATPDAADALDGMEEGWSQSLEKLAEYVEVRSGNDDTDVETTDTSLTVRRTFDAPQERVFEACTAPRQVDQWWGPDGFTTTTEEMDVSPGGTWRFVMVGPDGEEYPNLIAYDEVEEPERLVYTHGSPDDPEQFRVTVTFEEVESGRTALTMEMRFESADGLDAAIEFGADDGAEQTLGRLAEYLASGRGNDDR